MRRVVPIVVSAEAKRRDAAMTELQRLIDGGKFRMTIPVEEGRDSDTIIGAVVADSRRLEAERDALRDALRDAVVIMHTARKSAWGDHARALRCFDQDHSAALAALGVES